MLPRELRHAITQVLPLTTLQTIDETQRSLTANAAPENSYLCSTSFCRALLATRYALTEEILAEAYDAPLQEGLLLPLEFVVKIASLHNATAYDQHLYLDAAYGFLFALQAKRIDLANYYLVRCFGSPDNVIDDHALRYYVDQLPVTQERLLELHKFLPHRNRITERSNMTATNRYLLARDTAALTALPDFAANFLPLWSDVLTKETIAWLPTLRALLQSFRPSTVITCYLALINILLNETLDTTAITAALAADPENKTRLGNAARTVMNTIAIDYLHNQPGTVYTDYDWFTSSEVVYNLAFLRTPNLYPAVRKIWMTSVLIAGRLVEILRNTNGIWIDSAKIAIPIRSPSGYNYPSMIESAFRDLEIGGSMVCCNREILRDVLIALPERNRSILIVTTPEDSARLLPLRGARPVLFCPTSVPIAQLTVQLYPELQSAIPAFWPIQL